MIGVPERFLESGLKRTITISSSPVTNLVPALSELLGFPYGCVEQTTSKAMPMIYASALLDGRKEEYAKDAVSAGIERLKLMQTASGGLGYWPGDADLRAALAHARRPVIPDLSAVIKTRKEHSGGQLSVRCV